MSKQILLSWSGGKDSALALQALRAGDEWEVTGLLTSVTSAYDRISMHGVRRELLESQAASVGLPLFTITLDPGASNETYETAFHTALGEARGRHPGITAVAFGDLFLADVREYRERLLSDSGFEAVFPLWARDTSQLARRFVHDGFVARLVCVDTTQLDARFAGRPFDERLLNDLPTMSDPCGERGEFHTFVSAGPGLKRPVPYRLGELVLRDDRFMYCDLLPE